MKKIMMMVAVMAFMMVGMNNAKAEEAMAEAGEVVHVQALGLVCDFCARALEKVFMDTEKVDQVAVNLDESRIDITMKKGEHFDDEKITEMIVDSGYNVEGITRQ